MNYSFLIRVSMNFNEFIPQLSIDCVVFGFHDNELKVLLSKFMAVELWALQGGFVEQEEDIDAAAKRILEERTGLSGIFLEQFHVFGRADRQRLEEMEVKFRDTPYEAFKTVFLQKRFVSIGYYALVDFSKVNPVTGDLFEKSAWFDIDALPEMAFDHQEIVHKALEKLRRSLDYQLVGFNLMPEFFTMNELQHLYETILGTPLLRANFQRKMLDMNILERMEKKITGKAHKAPYLYRFANPAE